MASFSMFLNLLLAEAMIVFAVPYAQDHQHAGHTGSAQSFFLRANCPGEPWHGRHIVALPTSQMLGLENFTVHPETPPLTFNPVQLTNGNYALQAEDSGDGDGSKMPYLAALGSTSGTRTASMAVVFVLTTTSGAIKATFDSCPDGYTCVTDQWTFGGTSVDLVHPDFHFAGYKGNWAPFKDAGAEGWHVYWKGDEGLTHPIKLDLVSREKEEEDCDDSDRGRY